MTDLLWPGDARAGDLFTDASIVAAMVRVESAWLAARGHQSKLSTPFSVRDIAVAAELPPGPAFAVDIVNGDALAIERFGIERRVMARRAAQGR